MELAMTNNNKNQISKNQHSLEQSIQGDQVDDNLLRENLTFSSHYFIELTSYQQFVTSPVHHGSNRHSHFKTKRVFEQLQIDNQFLQISQILKIINGKDTKSRHLFRVV